MRITVHIEDPAAEMTFDTVRRSTLAEQGLCTSLGFGGVDVFGFAGYGVPPSAMSARLRELADEIDAAAAAWAPNQGQVA